ncbi:MAG: fused MFS/spermidine synthase, partial [Alphaproteobacteria bacterium]
IPSSLSMGLTALITSDMGSIPLFWVVPLGLYLLTFVIAFAAKRPSDHQILARVHLAAVVLQLLVFTMNNGVLVPSWIYVVLSLTVFVVTALLCHGRLADARPAAAALTEFYLWLAVGGALGGVFNAFLAPLMFTYPVEFVLVLCASVMVTHQTRTTGFFYRFRYYLAVLVLCAFGARVLVMPPLWTILAMLTVFSGLLLLCKFPRLLSIVGVIIALFLPTTLAVRERVTLARNFFGVAMVIDRRNAEGDTWRILGHGSTIHGIQRMTPFPDPTPVSYFESVGNLFAARPFADVGVIGLGAGIVICFDKPGRRFTAYEIDPLIKKLAMEYFTYIKDCGAPRWRIGDGRIELHRDGDARYDMIMVDAFSSGSIPSHLLTREALDVYIARLKPEGIILFNINNRYYDFSEPLAAMARDAGWQSWRMVTDADDLLHGKSASNWVLFAPGVQDMDYLKPLGWHKMPVTNFPVWHDDHANILAAMKLFSNAKTH